MIKNFIFKHPFLAICILATLLIIVLCSIVLGAILNPIVFIYGFLISLGVVFCFFCATMILDFVLDIFNK